jgi:two-component system, response regulator, stage 0 sporulation protein F
MNNKIKILYVDDEVINLQLFEINLKNKYSVLTAINAIKGLEILSENKDISIVVSDMKMPHMNGVEFIKKAKQDYPNIIFYILTGYEITEEIQDALSIGMILKYFQKPYNPKEIELEIENALKR